MNVTPNQIDRIRRTIKLCRLAQWCMIVIPAHAIVALIMHCLPLLGGHSIHISWMSFGATFIGTIFFIPLVGWALVDPLPDSVFPCLVLPLSNKNIKWVINEISKFGSRSKENEYLQYLAFSYRREIRNKPWAEDDLLNAILSIAYTEEEIQEHRKREEIKKFVMDNCINTSENAIIQADDCFKSFFVITGHVETKGDHELDHARSSQQLTILHTDGEICNIRTCEISKDTRIYIQKL